MNSALQYQLAKPIVDAVMKDAGLSNEGITGMAHCHGGHAEEAGKHGLSPGSVGGRAGSIRR